LEVQGIFFRPDRAHRFSIDTATTPGHIAGEANMTMISKTALVLATLVSLAPLGAARAEDDKLVVVYANTGQVVYDDGYNDRFCVIRDRFVGYDAWGREHYRRRTRCR
jgi:hypothetical protein